MEMFNFVLDSFKRGIFDFKVKRQDLIAGTVPYKYFFVNFQFIIFPTTLLFMQEESLKKNPKKTSVIIGGLIDIGGMTIRSM